MWCKESNFQTSTHVPLMVRAPGHGSDAGGITQSALVELVDIYPTMVELSGLPPLDPSIKGEPPLGGRSLVSLLRGGATSTRKVACSQYGRQRCATDLFEQNCPATGTIGKWQAKKLPKVFVMGYSVRTPEQRYTRWVNVTKAGKAKWDEVLLEELYDEAPTDDYDQSELANKFHLQSSGAALVTMREALATCFPSWNGR